MKVTKRIISILLTVIMLVSVMAVAPFTANAVSGVEQKLSSIQSVYPAGSYFTVNGGLWSSNEGSGCQLSKIPSRGGLPSGAQAASVTGDAWSCCGFAKYVFYCVFGINPFSCGTVSASNAKIGDFISFNNTHFGIYLGQDSSYWYVYDSNFTSPPTNRVGINTRISKSNWSPNAIYHANNYDEVNGTQQPTEIFFDFWGTDTSVLNEVKGYIKLWFKAMNCDYNNSDVNVYVDDKCIGTIYPDSSGCYSIEINTNNYGNSQHKINAIFRNKAGVELKSSDLYISIKNPQILFWNLPQNSIKDTYKIWLKASNCNFEKSIVKLYIDDICVVEFLNGSDDSGFYSYNLNTYTLSNGNHNLVASYNDIDGVNMTTYVNKINVYNGYIIFWGDSGIDGNIIDTKTKYWFKAVDCDYINSQLDIYIDNTIYKTVYSDDSGYFSVYIDPFEINNGNHSIKAQFKNPAGLMLNTNKITFISINKIMGDINGDGEINILDATEIQKHIAQLITLDELQLAVADVNDDEEISILDVTQIQKYLAEIIDKLG